MNSAGDTVLKLQVHLRNGILGEDRRIRDITWGLKKSCQSGRRLPVYLPTRNSPPGFGQNNVRIAALSTIFLMVNLFIALSLGVHLEQFEQRIGLTWPRPFLLRPLLAQYQHQLLCLLSQAALGRCLLGCSLFDHLGDSVYLLVYSQHNRNPPKSHSVK